MQNQNGYESEVLIFKALSDKIRIEILEMLSANDELCACKILENFKITQPTLSYHMKILAESGLVSCRRDGAWMRYSLNRENLKAVGEMLVKFAVINKSGG